MLHGIARSVHIQVKIVGGAGNRGAESSGSLETNSFRYGKDIMRRLAKSGLFAIALCLVWATTSTPAAAQGGPYDLHCENATSPQGITAPHPELSWTVNSAVMQRAYQVLVASSEEKLKNNEADLWDSGQVISDKKTVRYQGKPLQSLQHCYWKVRLWDTYYQATLYSAPASWKMGLLFFGKQEAAGPARRNSPRGQAKIATR
jgi:hypothetical protein